MRRTKCEGIQAKDFYVGAAVAIFSRNIRITDYADSTTRTKLQTKMQKYIMFDCIIFEYYMFIKIYHKFLFILEHLP